MPNNPQALSVFIPGNTAVLKFAEQPERLSIVLAEVLQGQPGPKGDTGPKGDKGDPGDISGNLDGGSF
ncbi:MAG: hypothetical protein LBQ81_12310 [Zoogloeaceae bacterium]|jgi:hypothetical protein|nr:hypothetical protein [Zoogloeaceae bacterium]